jgi:ABC-2 type transport system ATP-binding protein
MENVIVVSNLKKSYKISNSEALEALKNVNFSVKKGEIFGILGPNGAGKTTTLEIIEGLKQQTSGEVTVLGFNNITQSLEIKKRIGVQLQSSQYLQNLSLGELLDLFCSLYENSPKTKQELLALVNLTEKEQDFFKNLSGGQQQRFTIATSLVNNPEILFLDEPTTGLDPRARRDMWKLIKQLNSLGMTIVLTTHYMEEAEFLCSRVAVMDSGTVLEIDEPRKLIEQISETTQISFLADHNLDSNLFAHIPEIKKVYTMYPKIIIEISSLDKIAQVVQILKDNHVNFSGFTVKTATLEDVYLKLTGKEYEI